MAEDRFLIDTNVLLRWLEPSDSDHLTATIAVEQLILSGSTLCYTSQHVSEFWNASTRPANRNGFGLSPAQADLRAREFELQLQLLPDSESVPLEWRKMLVGHSISGVQVHDARLVATMRVHRVHHILTFNARDFRRFPDVQAILPQDLI